MQKLLINVKDSYTSERITLRSYKFGDGESYYNLLMANKEHFHEEVGELATIKTVADAEVFARNRVVDWIARKRFVMVIEKEQQMIGQIWIEPINWELRIFEIGYFIEKQNEGKGLVTDAVKVAMEFLFSDVAANKVEIHCKHTNTRSYRVAERLGFTKEGQLRNRDKTITGKLVNILYYGLLKEEYDRK